jgi:hypothetical protein
VFRGSVERPAAFRKPILRQQLVGVDVESGLAAHVKGLDLRKAREMVRSCLSPDITNFENERSKR